MKKISLSLICGAALIAAWIIYYRWVPGSFDTIIDDSYISARYAKNLLNGIGFLYQRGNFTNGVTNPLWAIMAIPGIAVGHLEQWYSLLGLLSYLGTVILTYLLSRHVFSREPYCWLTTALVAFNYSIVATSKTGLETTFQGALILLLLYLYTRRPADNFGSRLALVAVPLVMMLTRLDSILLIAPVLLVVVSKHGIKPAVLPAAGAVAGALLIVAVNQYIYGHPLPNTVYLRVGPSWRGVNFLGQFLLSYYFVWIFIFAIGAWIVSRSMKRPDPIVPPLLSAIIPIIFFWIVYNLINGGGWMEFRTFVVIIPLLYLVSIWVLSRVKLGWALCIAMLAANVSHGTDCLESAWDFRCADQFYSGATGFRDVAGEISVLSNTDATVAMIAAGELPYYSNVATLDMIGLVDADAAENGRELDRNYPGHTRIVDVGYLYGRGVNLVFGSVAMGLIDPPAYNSVWLISLKIKYWDHFMTPQDLTIVEIPLRSGSIARALYLIRHPAIDEQIENGTWFERPIVADLFNPFKKTS